MSKLEVKIVKLNIQSHPNAEKLEVGMVNGEGGYAVVIGKGQFQNNDLAIFIPEGSVIPENIREFLAQNSKIEVKDGRIRATRVRGQISEGLCLTPKDWLPPEQIKEDQDVTEYLGITKWEPPPQSGRGLGLKSKGINYQYKNENFKQYTDIDNFKKHPRAFLEGEEVVATIKYHGSNWRAAMVRRPKSSYTWFEKLKLWLGLKVNEMEYLVGSHRVIKKKSKRATVVEDKFVEVAQKYNIEKILKVLQTSLSKQADEFFDDGFKELPEVAIYGELIGPGIQTGYEYGLTEHDLRIFDIMVDGHYLDWDSVVKICLMTNLPLVEEVYRGPWHSDIVKLSEAVDEYHGKKYVREGIVIKPTKERRDARVGRVILKYISETFRLDKENSQYH